MSYIDNSTLCRYRYDPLDRLATCSPAEQNGIQRFYQKKRLTTEIQGQIQRAFFQTEDQLLAQHQGPDNCTLLASDQQRSVLDGINDAQRQSTSYTPYGGRHPQANPLGLLGFTGERADPVTGHYLLGNGYRGFNPVLMRFNSPDSFSPFGEGGLNAYAYCLGNPVNRVDPAGHTPAIFKSLFRGLGLMKKSTQVTKPHMKNLTIMGKDAYIFEDVSSGSNRLNIASHGIVPLQGQSTKMIVNDQFWSPQKIHSALENKGYKFDSFESIRLLVCYSGHGDTKSFAAEFANLSNRPVIGYKGQVSTNQSIESVLKVFTAYQKQYASKSEKYLARRYARKQLIINRPAEAIRFTPT
ncbi:RHS repeat-associated core domain-containing protein [Pseudomonas sp. Pseusp122]|uniref:RHS repeat-associated core domain-containing protein n=1 Tax=unclassified Pseudomonas TaxID=196821 RepID=UPI0039A4231B